MNTWEKYGTKKNAYYNYLYSNDWAIKRAKVLKRFNYTCAKCGAKNTPFNVHHLTYKHVYNERYYELILLCRDCHTAIHNDMQAHRNTRLINCMLTANLFSKHLVQLTLRIIHIKSKILAQFYNTKGQSNNE